MFWKGTALAAPQMAKEKMELYGPRKNSTDAVVLKGHGFISAANGQRKNGALRAAEKLDRCRRFERARIYPCQ